VIWIRPYRPDDLDALYRICLETGDSGQDATHLYRDPMLLGHVYAAPYGTLEPRLAFVLEDQAGVSGYVLGALDTAEFEDRLEREWWPHLRAKYPDPDGLPAEKRTPDQRIAHMIHHPHRTSAELVARYPSHLHIDLLPRAQGGGNGRRLIESLLDALRAQGSRGVHLGVGGANVRAIGFYRHMGFQEIARETYGFLFAMAL
jgi:ribosomal protein S18 acetylase RimI-like enzyme